VIIWSTQDWKIKKVIEHHGYTVYGMDFSEAGYFCSVSKDRKLAVFDREFELVFGYEAHSRAILCVSFSEDGKLVGTGGRDKFVRVHSVEEKKVIAEFEVKK
jgi:WD40 repeat protein